MKGSAALNLYRINKERVKFPGSEKMAAACGSSHDTFSTNTPSTAGTSRGAGSTVRSIPTAIPLNPKQVDSFWKKTWEMFKEYVLSVGSAVKLVKDVVSSVGQGIINKFLFD